MRSVRAESFRRGWESLPDVIKAHAEALFVRFEINSDDPLLRTKRVPFAPERFGGRDVRRVELPAGYRAVYWIDTESNGDRTAVWVFIGSHADYDKSLR